MLHAKFQDHMMSGFGEEEFLKVFTIYGHGGNLGHVTWSIYMNFGPPSKRCSHRIWLQGVPVKKIFVNGGQRTDSGSMGILEVHLVSLTAQVS